MYNELYHYGIPKKSGRYPYGSGERPYQGEGGTLRRLKNRITKKKDNKKKGQNKDTEDKRTPEEKKADILKSGSATQMYKNKELFTSEEIQKFLTLKKRHKELKGLSDDEIRAGKKLLAAYDKVASTMDKVSKEIERIDKWRSAFKKLSGINDDNDDNNNDNNSKKKQKKQKKQTDSSESRTSKKEEARDDKSKTDSSKKDKSKTDSSKKTKTESSKKDKTKKEKPTKDTYEEGKTYSGTVEGEGRSKYTEPRRDPTDYDYDWYDYEPSSSVLSSVNRALEKYGMEDVALLPDNSKQLPAILSKKRR